MDLKAAIEAIRREKHLSKADMAKILDMDPSNYNRLESRGEKLTIEQLQQIAKALDVAIIDLISWGESQPSASESKASNELYERIEELESALRDKSFIIRTLESNHRVVYSMFNVVFEHFARELNVGELQTQGITEKQKARDEKARKKGIDVVYPILYTEDDVYQIITYIHKKYPVFYYLLESLTKSNVVTEENFFATTLIKYSQDLMKRMKL